MKLVTSLPALALGLLLAVPAAAQDPYDPRGSGGDPDTPEGCVGIDAKVQIDGGSLSFFPLTVTIDAGQPACWTWQGSMPHSVKSDDGSFSSGAPAERGNFKRTFNTPGTYGYFCQVHGSATGGMRGTVIVRSPGGGEPGGSGPGTLSIDPAAYTVDENGGAVTLTVTRTGGSDGKVTVKIGTGAGSATKAKDFLPKNAVLTWNDGDSNPKSFSVAIKNDTLLEGNETFGVALSKATGRATIGTASATVTIDDDEGCPAGLAAPATLKAAGLSRSEVRLTWGAGSPSAASVHVERRQGSGAFQEIAVLPATLSSFVDSGLAEGSTFQYRLRAEGPAGLSDYSQIAAGATDGATGACAEGPGRLCLAEGRFEATVRYRNTEGEPARLAKRSELPGAPRSGLFSFGPDDEMQLLLNVLDGCSVNDHYWVHLAALTDLELDVAVRDTLTGRTWVFHNPAGKAAEAVRDLDALGTCP